MCLPAEIQQGAAPIRRAPPTGRSPVWLPSSRTKAIWLPSGFHAGETSRARIRRHPVGRIGADDQHVDVFIVAADHPPTRMRLACRLAKTKASPPCRDTSSATAPAPVRRRARSQREVPRLARRDDGNRDKHRTTIRPSHGVPTPGCCPRHPRDLLIDRAASSSSNCASASACRRRFGSLTRHRVNIRRSSIGVDGGNASSSGSLSRIFAMVSDAVSPANARRPVSISYTMQPNAQTSLRASAACPRACSGLMYAGVPRTTSLACDPRRRHSRGRRRRIGGCGLARPKSSTLTTPSRRILMFDGLRSRWTIPASCAAPIASAICPATATASAVGIAPCLMRSDRSSPSTSSITMRASGATGRRWRSVLQPVDMGDVEMIQRSERLRFAFKARDPFVVIVQFGRQDLDRDITTEPVSRAR